MKEKIIEGEETIFLQCVLSSLSRPDASITFLSRVRFSPSPHHQRKYVHRYRGGKKAIPPLFGLGRGSFSGSICLRLAPPSLAQIGAICASLLLLPSATTEPIEHGKGPLPFPPFSWQWSRQGLLRLLHPPASQEITRLNTHSKKQNIF